MLRPFVSACFALVAAAALGSCAGPPPAAPQDDGGPDPAILARQVRALVAHSETDFWSLRGETLAAAPRDTTWSSVLELVVGEAARIRADESFAGPRVAWTGPAALFATEAAAVAWRDSAAVSVSRALPAWAPRPVERGGRRWEECAGGLTTGREVRLAPERRAADWAVRLRVQRSTGALSATFRCDG